MSVRHIEGQSCFTDIQVGAGSSQGKRVRTQSTESTTPESQSKRPRALDVKVPRPVYVGPISWAYLNKQITTAWTYNAAMAKLVRNGAKSMLEEDLTSRIVTQRKLCITFCVADTDSLPSTE